MELLSGLRLENWKWATKKPAGEAGLGGGNLKLWEGVWA
jgi:hypothetical protein